MTTEFEALDQAFSAGDATAAERLFDLADAGDPQALYRTGEFRFRAIGRNQDVKDGFKRIAAASARGMIEARRAEAYLVNQGIGARRDPAKARALLEKLAKEDRFTAVQLAFLDRLQERPVERTIVSKDPHIEVVHGLLSPEECRYIQLVAQPWMVPAMIVGLDGKGMRDPHRDSDNMAITPLMEDLVIQRFNQRIADATGTDARHGEPLTVLRYGPGQQYRPHHDAHVYTPIEKRRHYTAILYLNDGYEGGETGFPKLGIKVRGVAGDLLVFRNLKADGSLEEGLVHAGNPVTRGEKWIATRWIWGSSYLDDRGSNSEESP